MYFMTTKQISGFYRDLREDVRNARTPKALKILESRSLNFVRQVSGPEIKSSLRKKALQEHRKTMKLISSMRKKLK